MLYASSVSVISTAVHAEYEVHAVQARAEELSDHEEQLEAWKQKFKAEALRQISEREKALSDWQAKLDRKRADLEELQRSVEVRHLCMDAGAVVYDKTCTLFMPTRGTEDRAERAAALCRGEAPVLDGGDVVSDISCTLHVAHANERCRWLS